MKIIAILVILYFMLGFIAGMAVIESRGSTVPRTAGHHTERPPLELPLEISLLAILLGLPVLGYRRARKQGSFLRFSPRVWLILPPSLFMTGLGAGFLASRFL